MTQATPTDYKHIVFNTKGVPVISGTTMKVVELITSVQAYGWSPEELHENYPYLSMSQIYSVLAYYWENKEQIDREIKRIDQWAEQSRLEAGESPLVKRLRNQGLLP